LVECGKVLISDDGVSIPEFREYQGDKTNAERQKRYRERASTGDSVTSSNGYSALRNVTSVMRNGVTLEENRGEENRSEKKIPPIVPPYGEDFIAFWKAYPKRTGKGAAWKAWQKTKRERPALAVILKAIEQQSGGSGWLRDGGAYIPNPATWLNQLRWEDEPPKTSFEMFMEREERKDKEREEQSHGIDNGNSEDGGNSGGELGPVSEG